MKVNVVIVFHPKEDQILMCLRQKDPYQGKYNLIGGKLEPNEVGIDAAYRELQEETGIAKDDIVLHHLMDAMYYLSDTELQVYVGRLQREVMLVEEVNPLLWMDANDDFFDCDKFAGEGNIGHMLEQVKLNRDVLLG